MICQSNCQGLRAWESLAQTPSLMWPRGSNRELICQLTECRLVNVDIFLTTGIRLHGFSANFQTGENTLIR